MFEYNPGDEVRSVSVSDILSLSADVSLGRDSHLSNVCRHVAGGAL